MVPNSFVLFLALVFLTPASAQESWNPEELMPLAVGNRWTYKVNGEDRFVIVASRKEKIGEQMCLRLEGRVKEEVVSSEWMALRGEGLFRYRNDGQDIDPPLNLCKLPIKSGDTWKITYKVGGRSATIRYDAELESIAVPAGKYNTIQVRSEVGDEKNKVKSTSWYAPKVGMVKQVIEEGKMTWTLELEKFEPAAEKK